MRRIVWLCAGLWWAAEAAALDIPESELGRPPTAECVARIQTEAAHAGWSTVALVLRDAAVRLYERHGSQAQTWYYLYRWADLFSLTGAQAVNRWNDVVAQAHRPGLPADPPASQRALADMWPADLQTFALTSPDFSDQFFTLLAPLDHPPRVMSILAALWSRDPADFKHYANLAIAIAVVYDVPPSPDWPHGQVSSLALSRKLVQPRDVFGFFVRSDRAGATLLPLRTLPAAELKFVVDTTSGFAELAWAQSHIRTPLDEFAKIYDLIRYRRDRVEAGILAWPLPTYGLPDIAREGGICVDQAYFAWTVGKAKGVPTLLFRGAGLDGRHAWFGFLDGTGHWHLDGGRHAEQKFVAGLAFDPQTWTNISDHEIAFLSEGFRRLTPFKSSRMHTQFAELYLAAGDSAAAGKAARVAVNLESRNLDAWVLLVNAQQRLSADPKPLEALFEEGARAFQRYPDVEIEFKSLLSRSLRVRGETSAADFAERSTARKYEATRQDLSVQQAQEILQRSMDNDDLNNRIRTFYRVLNSYGHGAGMDFFDRIVHPFVEHLLQNDRPGEAEQALIQARRTLRVEPNTQLEAELNALAERIPGTMR